MATGLPECIVCLEDSDKTFLKSACCKRDICVGCFNELLHIKKFRIECMYCKTDKLLIHDPIKEEADEIIYIRENKRLRSRAVSRRINRRRSTNSRRNSQVFPALPLPPMDITVETEDEIIVIPVGIVEDTISVEIPEVISSIPRIPTVTSSRNKKPGIIAKISRFFQRRRDQ